MGARFPFDRTFGHLIPAAGVGQNDTAYYHCQRNHIQQRDSNRDDEDSLGIVTLMLPNLERNESLRRFTRSGTCGLAWSGPVIVSRQRGRVPEKGRCVDVEMRDVRTAADYFSSDSRGYGANRKVHSLAAVISPRVMVQNGSPAFMEKAIDHGDIVYSEQGSAIVNLLGIPLQVRPAVESLEYVSKDSNRGHHTANDYATLLKRDLNSTTFGCQLTEVEKRRRDSKSASSGLYVEIREPHGVEPGIEGFASCPETRFDYDVCGALVGRADGLPLPAQHMEAICEYLKQEVEPILRAAIDGLAPGTPIANREEVLNGITKQNFLRFWDTYSAHKVMMGEWTETPSPYEMKGSVLEEHRERTENLFVVQRAQGLAQWCGTPEDPAWAEDDRRRQRSIPYHADG